MGSIGVNERAVTGMDEYISKESAISIFRAKAEMAVCTPAQTYFDRAAKMLELLPAADVAPVRHGRWDNIPNTYMCVAGKDGSYHGNATSCSVCHEINPNAYKTNYCPNCGAKMDLEGLP